MVNMGSQICGNVMNTFVLKYVSHTKYFIIMILVCSLGFVMFVLNKDF